MNSASLGGGREPDEGVQLIDDEVESKGQAKSAVMMLSDNSLISVGGNVDKSQSSTLQIQGDKKTNLGGHKIDRRRHPSGAY
jgi:hypothetical protein